MNKKQGLLFGIALMLFFTGIALATTSASSDVVIYAFDQNPAGSDKGNEWLTLYNPSKKSVDIGNWTFKTVDGERETIPEDTTLYPFAYYIYSPPYQWLDNSDEAITLRDTKGEEVDVSPVVSDNENDNRYWMRNNSEWTFGVKELEKGEIWGGVVKHVVDGDTVDVSFGITGIQRIRLVGVNTPEIGEEGYEEAKEFVNVSCLGEVVNLDVDDKKQYDPYYRILAVIYVNGTNLNEKLVRGGYAEIMYIPPSEFNPYEWKAKVMIRVEAERVDFHYQNESFWTEDEFLKILEDKTFKANLIKSFNESLLSYGVYATNCKVEFNEAKKSVCLKCDVHNAISKTGNNYRARFEWLLRPLGLDFFDDFERSEKELSCEKSIDDVSTNIRLRFPASIDHCHAHVWWTLKLPSPTPTPAGLPPTLTPAPTLMPSPSPVYTPLPSPTLSPTPTPMPGFEFLFAILGVLAGIYLIRRRDSYIR